MMSLEKVNLPVAGMSCASCAVSVESMIKSQDGVANAQVNYANQTVFVEFNKSKVDLKTLKKVVNEIGYDLIIEEINPEEIFDKIVEKRYKQLKNRLIIAIIFSLPVFVLSMFFHELSMQLSWLLLLLSVPVVFYSGSQFYINAFKQTRHLQAGMDTLIAVGTGAAFLFSVFNTFFSSFLLLRRIPVHLYYESAVIIITLVLLGKFFEERSRTKASFAIRKLIGLKPKTLNVIRNGETFEIPIEEVLKGDLVLVKPGEKIPIDGQVIDGESYVDESSMTGEAIPVAKMQKDKVFAGTFNQNGSLHILAEKVGKETTLSHIIELIREAQASKPPIQKLVDKISSVFVPVVIGLAVLTFVLWYNLSDYEPFIMAFISAVTVLIIACPCALGLATPTALVTGLGKAAENGILISNSQALEIAAKVNTIVLDKTGTITSGKPEINDIQWIKEEYKTANNLSVLYSMESMSGHPVADAVAKHLFKSFQPAKTEFKSFENITGYGLKALNDGQVFLAGNRKLLEKNGVVIETETDQILNQYQNNNQIIIFFACYKQLLAVITLSDNLKENAKHSIELLTHRGMEIYLLSGDSLKNTSYIAGKAAITNYKAEMSPADKLWFIQNLQKQGRVVAMAGDGINDAGALAQADLGIAMATGSDIAMESAGVTLLHSDLKKIISLFTLSTAILKTIRQNLFWAFFYNVLAIPLAAGVLYPLTGILLNPMIAGATMAISSVSVVANSLRLKNIHL